MTKAYAAQSSESSIEPTSIVRRSARPDDVVIDIEYCGICHSDLHMAHNDWGMTQYPLVPGHEIIGTVIDVGTDVSEFNIGQRVGVGCLVDSCRSCSACGEGLEQYCEKGWVGTYNGVDLHDGTPTYGGYSERIVVSDRFVLSIPDALDPAAAAPLLCAGITTYSPLKYFGLSKGHKIGVVGMGGLGHMGIKFAKAFGAEVTLFTRSAGKVDEARRHGVDHVIVSTDTEAMDAAAESLDFILDTAPVQHDLNPYLQTLSYDGTYILVGLIEPVEPALHSGGLVFKRRKLVGSLIGGLPETQEMLEFCAEHDIVCDIETIPIQEVNQAWERVQQSDVRYRFVIDMQSLND